MFRGLQAAMTGDHVVIVIHQNRVGPTESRQ
jgi:hypothetical protein